VTLNLNVKVQLLALKQATISWDAPNADDTSWLFVNGIKVFGPMAFETIARTTPISFIDSLNKDIEIRDFATVPSTIDPITIQENKRPSIEWQHLTGTAQYRIFHTAPGESEALVQTVTVSDDRQLYQVTSPVRLVAGWHQFRVESVSQFGIESTRNIWVYEVFQLDAPVNDLTISDGSGSGLFDFVIG